MLHTELRDRILGGNEGRLFAETLLSMLDIEIGMGEVNPDWNPVFRNLTHEQRIWLVNFMMRAALLVDVPIPEFTAEGEATLAAVYEHIYNNIIIELDEAREASERGDSIEDWLFWRKMLLAAAKDKHLAEMFGEFVESEAVTDAIHANNEDQRCDGISIWPKETCDDLEEWESIIDLLEHAVLFDSDWLLSETMLDLPGGAAGTVAKDLGIPAGYFSHIHPDPLPEQAKEAYVDMILFLRQYLGYPIISREEVLYHGPANGASSE